MAAQQLLLLLLCDHHVLGLAKFPERGQFDAGATLSLAQVIFVLRVPKRTRLRQLHQVQVALVKTCTV